MTIANNTVLAKIFAALAVAALVVSSVAAFAPVAGAQTTTTTTANGSATSSITFAHDLTIGSTGVAVTALQTYLIAKGHGIAAGATGYFGAQTQAALAAYQAANGISPAVGYFGPITRAKVNSDSSTGGSTGGTGTGTGTGSTGGDLSGGEANLTDFNLVREESQGDEGEEEVSVFTVEFDVEDGDVRVERMEITASSTDSTSGVSKNPWDYFDRVSIWVDGDEVADMDVDSRSDWDEQADDVYELTLTGLDIVVEEGDMAEITVAFDIAGTIDSADLGQDFDFYIETDGIRAVDAEGIQQYIGRGVNSDDHVSFGFGEEENGDLSITSSNDDPNASILVADADEESEEYSVFIFTLENDEDADSLLTDLVIDVTDLSADVAIGAETVIRRATLVVDGDEFDGDIDGTTGNAGTISFDDMDLEVEGDSEMDFELMVTLVRNATSTPIVFSVDGGDVDAEGLDSGDTVVVDGDAESAEHSIALDGIVVEPVSTSQTVTTFGDSASDTRGTYTIKFDVTALEEDAFIASTSADAIAGVGVSFEVGGNVYSGTTTAIVTSTADSEDGFYRVDEGDTETFTLTVTLDPATAGTYDVRLETIRFNDADSFTGSSTFSVDQNESDYRTDPIYIAS